MRERADKGRKVELSLGTNILPKIVLMLFLCAGFPFLMESFEFKFTAPIALKLNLMCRADKFVSPILFPAMVMGKRGEERIMRCITEQNIDVGIVHRYTDIEICI